MYHTLVSEERLSRMVDQVRKMSDPLFDPCHMGKEECWNRADALTNAVNDKGEMVRGVSTVEERWILDELTLCKADFRYWVARWARIKTKDATLEPIKLWESQRIILDKISEVERDAHELRRGDGVIVAILKARQLGASTLIEAIIAHRAFFYGNLMGLIAGDVPEQSAYLFDMIERIYENLPWWMKPELTYHVKDAEMYFGKTDALVRVASGKSVRGGSDMELGKGQMGRGKTPHIAHLSELSTWPNPEQLDDSFWPSLPRKMHTFCGLESTARGRGNYWHDTWVLAKKGLGRAVPVFIPWYAEEETYRYPVPEGWEPSDLAKAHAAKAEEVSAYWCGRTIRLDKEQLYWWERTREEYKEKKKLSVFLAEYCATDEEAFQNTSLSVFGNELLHEQRLKAKKLAALVEVNHRTELATH